MRPGAGRGASNGNGAVTGGWLGMKGLDNKLNICYTRRRLEVKKMNVTMTVDEETLEAMQAMPRNMSASRLLRHLIRAASYDEKRWSAYRKTAECKLCIERLKPIMTRFK